MFDDQSISDHALIYRILREMHFMPYILIVPKPAKKKIIMPPKIEFLTKYIYHMVNYNLKW